MFPFKKILTTCAALCTASCFSLSALAAELHYVFPLYPLDRISAGKVILHIPEEETLFVQIIEHSPEQKNLVLYDTELKESTDTDHVFSLESGEYTIVCSTYYLTDNYKTKSFTQDFTIENPDFSDTLTETNYELTVDIMLREDDDDTESQMTPLQESTTEGICTLSQQMHFTRYNGNFGDYDRDGVITMQDAMETLTCYNSGELGLPLPCNAAEKAACDIYPDGEITIEDAMAILQYYNDGILGIPQSWDFVEN